MVRASTLPEGVTAPIDRGFSIQDRMKRTSSSSRMPFFCSNRRMRRSICFSSIWKAANGIGRNATTYCKLMTAIGKAPRGGGQAEASSGAGARSEQVLDFGEEARGFRLRLLRRQLLEFGQQLALPLGQILRRLHHDL